jgi:TetR/AcrR family transcriptional regulator
VQVAPVAEAIGRPASRETSQRTRIRILEAATREFAERGFDAGRMDEIALRAGVAKNVLYYYFGSKDDLFSAVLERTYEAIRARQQDLHLRNLEPVEAMRQLVVFTGRIWSQFPHFQRLLHSENLHEGRHVARSERIPQLYNPLMDTLQALLARGHTAGVFRADVDPVDLYISITSLSAHYVAHQHTFAAIFGKRLMTPGRLKQRLDHAADMVLAYLRAAPAAAARKPITRALPEAARRPRGAARQDAPARSRSAPSRSL